MTFSIKPLATMTRTRITVLSLALTVACGGVIYATFQASSPAPVQLAAYAPTGALLSIESPDFAGLLSSWNNSAEQKRWLASDNYAGFLRSRLFALLERAQEEFGEAANLGTDGDGLDNDFLQQVAGQQSLFAWYDISNLEFLYITHLPPGAAAKLSLLKVRDQFQQRTIGNTTFYIDTNQQVLDADTPSDPSADPAEPASPQKIRTAAFAIRGDYLILATREDLLTSALQLMQQPSSASDTRTLQHEAWYAAAIAAAPQQPGDLRIAVNLAKVVPSPFFRTYWAPQNITELKQYNASLSDLYRTPSAFREERILLAADPTKDILTDADLAPVLSYLPANTGVYRASAQPSVKAVLAQLQDKLLVRQPATSSSTQTAPQADLGTPTTGDANNFDQRIDEPLLPAQPVTAALAPLSALLTAAPPSAMLTFSTALPAGGTYFAPIHTAVVLASTAPWDQNAVQQALATAIAPTLTIGSAGTAWTSHHNATAAWFELSGNTTLALAVQGKEVIIASDTATLFHLLTAAATAPHTPQVATIVAGFNHHEELSQILTLTSLLDHTATPVAAGTTPPFFSGNIASLSQTFQDLDAESFTQFTSPDAVTHQTVVYQWHP